MVGLLLSVLLGFPESIWYDAAHGAILTRNDFWDIPVRVNDLHRDLFESAIPWYAENCEGGVWYGEQILRIDYSDTIPRCTPDGRTHDALGRCRYWGPCRDACDGWWGCRTDVWTCCFIPVSDLWMDASCDGGQYAVGPTCLMENPGD